MPPPHLAQVVARMRSGGYFDRVMSAGPELGRVKEFLLRCAGERDPGYDGAQRPKYPMFPGLRHRPFHDTAKLAAAQALEAAFPLIREEASRLDEASHLDYTRAVRDNPAPRAWTVYLFHHMGVEVESVQGRCPRTFSLLRSLPGACHDYPWCDTLFSAMGPGAHLAPHCSIDNLRLRLHLGVSVPPGCSLRVGSEVRDWEDGRVLAFEDSFEHEVWNRSKARRVVLIADLWHPDLTAAEIRALTAGFAKSEVREVFMAERLSMTDAPSAHLRHLGARVPAQDQRPEIREYWAS